ncbi:MAG: phage tail protein [bacterium]
MDGYMGEIRMFAGTFAPVHWALCQGQLLPISGNDALFSILGTTYGGDGRTTFALPDMRGRAPMQAGQGPGLPNYDLGRRGGSPENVLTTAQLPEHTHAGTMHAETRPASTDSPSGNLLAVAPVYSPANPRPDHTLHADSLKIEPMGGSQPFSIESPYQVVNFIICMEGTYPSRP